MHKNAVKCCKNCKIYAKNAHDMHRNFSRIVRYQMKLWLYCDKKCFAEYKPKRVDYQKRLGESIRNAIIVPKLDADTSWTTDGIHAIASKHSTLKKHVGDYIKDVEKSNKTSTTTNNKDDKKEKFKKYAFHDGN